MQRTVWHSNYVDLMIFREDDQGRVLNTTTGLPVNDFNPLTANFPPLLLYCYLQGANLKVGLSNSDRRKVTGRSHRRILIGQYDDCTLSCDYFLYSKKEEMSLQYIFNRQQRLRLVCKLINPEYGAGLPPFENEVCQLTRALAQGFSIGVPENDVIKTDAEFSAEEFL